MLFRSVSLNLEHLALLFIADMSQNDSSYRRQNSSDNVKRFEEIAMEDPMTMAAALSLAGAGSLVIHRWSTSLSTQRKFVMNFWENFAIKKKNVCHSVAMAGCPLSVCSVNLKGFINTGTFLNEIIISYQYFLSF